MSDFPLLKTEAVLQYPASRRIEHSTCVLRFLDGTEQRFREYSRPRHLWEIRLELLDESEMARLEEFFESQQGRSGNFSFTDPWDETVYENCSLASDILALDFQDVMRGQATLIVEEDGE